MDSHCISIVSNSSFNFSYIDRYGYRWSLELAIKTMTSTLPTPVCMNKLQLNVKNENSSKPQGNFQVVLKIVHDLPLKTISQNIPFKLLDPPKSRHISTEIANVRFLRNEGFVEKDMLKLKIGIGPYDPTTELNCYQQALAIHRNQICTLKCELTNWKKFNISYFRMEECPAMESKRSKTKCSNAIIDEHGAKWLLKVSINGKRHKGFIGVFLTKCNGSKGWYDYFIELIHPQAERRNRIVKGCHLFDVEPLELPQYMTIAFLDPFMDDGTLRFRFGTRKDLQESIGLTSEMERTNNFHREE